MCDLMIRADNACCSSERYLGPENSYSEPVLALGFGNVKREMEKPSLLLLLLLGNSRVIPFSCSKLTGNQLIKQTRTVLAECAVQNALNVVLRLSLVLPSLRAALGTLFLQYERAILWMLPPRLQ